MTKNKFLKINLLYKWITIIKMTQKDLQFIIQY